MTDVRLTATNPEDSSVVPVACNSRGELLVEPPAEPSSNFPDGLTVGPDGGTAVTTLASDGSATFNGGLDEFYTNGSVSFYRNTGNAGSALATYMSDIYGVKEEVAQITCDGSASFKGSVSSGFHGININNVGGDVNNEAFAISAAPGNGEYARKFTMYTNGSASFEGNIAVGGNVFIADNPGILAAADGYLGVRRSGTNVAIQVKQKDNPAEFTAQITADGKAVFGSDVVIGSRNKQWMIVESNGLAHLVEQTRAGTADLPGATADLASRSAYPPLRDIPGELTMVEQQLQKVMERLKMAPEAGWEVWDGSD